jgi:hypothetical protein
MVSPGNLAYQTGRNSSNDNQWIDRSGKKMGSSLGKTPALPVDSPDGSHVAIEKPVPQGRPESDHRSDSRLIDPYYFQDRE